MKLFNQIFGAVIFAFAMNTTAFADTLQKDDVALKNSPLNFLMGKTWQTSTQDGGVMTASYVNEHSLNFSVTYGSSTAIIPNIKIQATTYGYRILETASGKGPNGVWAQTNAGEKFRVLKQSEEQVILVLDDKLSFVYKLVK